MAFTFLEDAPVGVTFLDDEPATGVTFLDEPVGPVAPAPQFPAPSFTATMPVKVGQPIGTPQDFATFDPNALITAPDSPAPSQSVNTGDYNISYAKAAPTNAVPALNPINGEWTPEVIASQNARADEFNRPTESALRERSYNEALNPLFQLTQGPLKPQAPRELTEDERQKQQDAEKDAADGVEDGPPKIVHTIFGDIPEPPQQEEQGLAGLGMGDKGIVTQVMDLPIFSGLIPRTGSAGIDALSTNVENLITPTNALIAIGLGGAPAALQKAASVYFAVEMGKGTVEQGKEAYTAYKEGDMERAGAALVGAGFTGLMTAAAAAHVKSDADFILLSKTRDIISKAPDELLAVSLTDLNIVKNLHDDAPRIIIDELKRRADALVPNAAAAADKVAPTRPAPLAEPSGQPSSASQATPEYQYESKASQDWWEKQDALLAKRDAIQADESTIGSPERKAIRDELEAHGDLIYTEQGRALGLGKRRINKNNPLEKVNVTGSQYDTIGQADITGWKFDGEWKTSESGKQFRRVISPNGKDRGVVWKDTLHPLENAALEKNNSNTSVAQAVLPSRTAEVPDPIVVEVAAAGATKTAEALAETSKPTPTVPAAPAPATGGAVAEQAAAPGAKAATWFEHDGTAPTPEQLSSRLSELDAAIIKAKEGIASVKANNAAIRKATPLANTKNIHARTGNMKMRSAEAGAKEYLDSLEASRADVVKRFGEPATPAPAAPSALEVASPVAPKPESVAEVAKAAADKEALRQAGVGGMGGAERDAMEARLKASATSNKESVVNQERATEGFDPVTKEEKIENIATLDNAEAVLEQNPNKGSEIVARLTSENPQERTISLQDGAVMLVDRSKLKSQREDAANRSVDPDLSQLERNAARITYSEINEKIRKLDEAAQDARSTWGRFGQFWQQMLRDDFTFDALRRKIEAAKGERLDPNSPADAIVLEKLKEDAAKHEAEAAVIAEREKANLKSDEQKHRISELENLLTEAGKKPAKAAAKERIPNDYAPNKPFGEKVIAYADAKAAEALIRIRQKIGGQLGSAPDLTILADAAIYGAAKLTKGAVKFTKWSAEMAVELGDWIKPHAKELWEQSKAQVENMASEAPRDIAAERASTVEGMKEVVKNTENRNELSKKLHPYARALAKQFIDEGMTKMEDIDAAVHAALKEVIPDITEREAGKAWTGYGDWKPASTEPATVTLANVTGERRAALKLEGVRDLNEARQNTGQGRQPPTAQARITEKEAARLEKEKGLKPVDPEKAHKTAMETVKNRLRNEIEELNLALATRKRIIRDKSGVEYDAEAKDLQAQRDAKKAEYNQVFPKEPITVEEQLRRATIIAERNAETWKKRAADAEKGIFPTKEKVQGPINQRIQAARDQAAAAQAEVAHLRDLDSATQERKTQAALDSAGEKLADILKNGEKPKPGKREGPVTAETAAKQHRNEMLRNMIADARELSGETAAKKAEAIGRALDKEIERVNRELETGVRRDRAERRNNDTPENEQKRSELDAMRKLRAEIDKVPGKTIDEKKLDSLIRRRDALQKEVDSGKIDPKAGRPTAATAEQAKIQEEIDALNERKAQMREAANPKTPEHIRELQRIQDRLDAAKDRLARGQIEPETGKPTVRDKAQTDALAELKAINETIAQMRRDAAPKLSPAMRSLRAERARLTRSIADKTIRRFTDQFKPEAKAAKPVPLTPEEIKADMELNTLRAEHKRTELKFKQAEAAYERKNRTTSVKIFEGISEWSRTAILAGAKIIGKLTSAAAEIIAAAPIEQAVGAAVSKILPRSIREKATTRSQFSIETEIKAVTETFRNFIKDAKDAFKTGNTDIDLLYGDPRVMPPELKNYLGNMHYALKSPAARNAWVRYFEYQMKSEAKASARRGEVFNPRDPMTQLRIGQEAYKRAAKPSIFSEDNVVANTYKAALGYLGKIKNERGEPMFSAQVLKLAADFSLPIVKIPTNIVARIFEYSFGTLMAPARIGNAGLRGIFMEKKATGEFNLREGFRKGLENLKPEEVDIIIQNLARGSLGATLLAIGFVMPNSFGGYYSRGQKRNDNDVEFGGMRFYGIDVPRWMVHNPLLEQVQIGATLRRVANSKLKKSDSKTQGLEVGALAAYLGVLEEAPMVSEMLDIAAFRDKPDVGSIGGGITGRFVPQFIKETARALDKDSKGKPIQREPENQWERFEMNFPYLRTRVKRKQIKQRR